jgi:hypothetical protein
VRALVVVVLASGCVFGFVVLFLRSAHRQRLAVAAISSAQGSAHYDRPYLTGTTFANGQLAMPKWLVRRIGVDYFANVVQVYLPASASDQDLSYVGELTSLEVLAERSAPNLTDAGVRHLKGLSALHTLLLPNTKLTDAGLVHLSRMTGLKNVDISQSQVADAGLLRLQGLTALESLKLDSTPITDAGLVHLKSLVALRSLSLRDTKISDRGLVNLEKLSRLEYLDLTKTAVTDAGVQRLKQVLPTLAIRCE